VAGLVAMTLSAGCASSTLEIRYPETAASHAPSFAPRRVVVARVTDRRGDTSRIGAAPEDGKPILASRPVPDIVRDALVAELRRSGHEVVAEAGDMVVSAEVDEFWLDAIGHSASVQYVGRVAIAIAVTDGHTGEPLLRHRYVGITRRTGDSGSRDAWRDVIEVALARTIHDVATDRDLVSALGPTRL
jgi:uncharacterized lipoprotein YajG